MVDSTLSAQLYERRTHLTSLVARDSAAYLRDLLTEVDAALRRVEDGTYGRCDVCHDPVEADRLRSDPLCRLCLDHLTGEERRALEHDLELAGRIQNGLLPAREQRFCDWVVRTHYQPAGAVSGDYVDLIRSDTSSDSAIFAFGDISGKGVAASLLMSNLHAIFRSLAPLDLALGDLIERANHIFCENTLPSAYATLVCGRLAAAGRIDLVNAGHLPPLVVRPGGVEGLGSSSLPLGLFCSGRYTTRSIELAPGDTLFLYTDGLTEATDPADSDYGIERLQTTLATLSPETAIAGVLADLDAFRSGERLRDDLTLTTIARV